MGLSGQKPRIGFCLFLGWFMFECPRYCEIFGPGACAGVFDEKECVMSTYREESLPETLQDMSDRFGKPFVRHMIERFAGITLIIPAKSRKTQLTRELCAFLGQDALSDFLHTYGGTRIYIPTLRRAKIRARDMDINAERDELARKGLSERALVARLATLHGLSERQVWRILKQPRTSDNRKAAL